MAIDDNGFTLIEIVVTLIIVGILGTAVGAGIVTGVRGYLLASASAEATQNAEIALTRLTREFMEITGVNSASNTAISFQTFDNNRRNVSLSNSGTEISIGSNCLVDNVTSFSLIYNPDSFGNSQWSTSNGLVQLSMIRINLSVNANGVPQNFTNEVNLRNNGNYGGVGIAPAVAGIVTSEPFSWWKWITGRI